MTYMQTARPVQLKQAFMLTQLSHTIVKCADFPCIHALFGQKGAEKEKDKWKKKQVGCIACIL